MAVAFDAFSQSGAEANPNWVINPVGTPKAVIVWVMTTAGSTPASVTASGVAMAATPTSPANKAATEAGAVHCYHLGASIPAGALTIAVDMGGAVAGGYAVTLTASGDTQVVDDAIITSNSVANPFTTLVLGGATSWAGIGFISGQGAVGGITPLTGWTSRAEVDNGAATAAVYTYNTIGSTNVTAGWTQTADDAIALAVAVSEAGISGSLAKTLDNATAAGVGSVAIAGTASVTGSSSVASAGSVAVTGSATPAGASATVAAQGAISVTGTAALSAESCTVAAAGTVADAGTSGDLAVTLAGATVSALADVAIAGAAAMACADATVAGAADVTVGGAAAIITADAIMAAAGQSTIDGALSRLLDDATVAALGSVGVAGSAALALDSSTVAAVGALPINGALAVTLAGSTVSAAADEESTPALVDPVLMGRYGILWTGQEIV